MPSTPTQKIFSLRVEIESITSYDGTLSIFTDQGGLPYSRTPLKRDMMYEQVQVIVDNHLRLMTKKLTAAMRLIKQQEDNQHESEI